MTTVGEGGEDFCVLIYVKHSTNQKTLSNTGYGTDYLHLGFFYDYNRLFCQTSTKFDEQDFLSQKHYRWHMNVCLQTYKS